MTFLEIVQRLHRRGGASGSPPISTENQSGEALRLVEWVQDADYNIQTKWLNWKFLHARTGNNFRVITNGPTPRPIDLFTWDRGTFRIRETQDDDWQPLVVQEYENTKGEFLSADSGQPYRAIIQPDNSIVFDPEPDKPYYFRGDYYSKPARMVRSSDVSKIPEEYHGTVILGTALEYFANYEDSPELMREAQGLMVRHMTQLESSQLPNQASQFTMGSDNLQVGTDF